MKTRVLVLILCLSFLLTSCGRNTMPKESHLDSGAIISDAVAPHKSDGVTELGLAYQSQFGLNPYTCTNMTNRTIISLLYESLFTVTSNFEVEPVLCKYYDVSEDLKEYTIHLLPNVKFCDGTPLTSQDVAASYHAAIDSEFYGRRFYTVYDISTPDSNTIIFRTAIPYENLPLLLDVPIVRADTVDSNAPIGTGPYRLISERYTNTLGRNGYWWRDPYDAALSVISIRLVPTNSPTDVRDDFEYGITGVVCTDPNSSAYVDYHCDYELWNCSTTMMDYIGFNVSSGLFCLTDLRVALTNIIDRNAIVTEIYHGYGEAAILPVSPLSNFYDAKLAEPYDYHPDKFKQAVTSQKARGSSAVFLVCNSDPCRVATADFIAEEAEKYGIELVVDSVNENVFKNRLYAGDFDLYFGEVKLSPTFDLSPFFNGGALCYGSIYSGNLTTMCQEALENSGNYYNLHSSIMAYGMLCPVLFKSYAIYATRGTITNMYPAVDNVFHTSNGRTLSDAILAVSDTAEGSTANNSSDLHAEENSLEADPSVISNSYEEDHSPEEDLSYDEDLYSEEDPFSEES